MCYPFMELEAQEVCLHQRHHKRMSNALHYNVTTATTLLQLQCYWVIGIFQFPYNLMGPPSYMWSIAEEHHYTVPDSN